MEVEVEVGLGEVEWALRGLRAEVGVGVAWGGGTAAWEAWVGEEVAVKSTSIVFVTSDEDAAAAALGGTVASVAFANHLSKRDKSLPPAMAVSWVLA